jgi:hypothetical protein
LQAGPAKDTIAAMTERRLWKAAFGAGMATLVGSLILLFGFPAMSASADWIPWLAIGAAVLCAVAAVRLRSTGRFEAAGEGAELALSSRRGLKDMLDGLDDVDH